MGIVRKVSLSRPENEAGATWPAIAMGFFVAFGGVLFGYVAALAQLALAFLGAVLLIIETAMIPARSVEFSP